MSPKIQKDCAAGDSATSPANSAENVAWPHSSNRTSYAFGRPDWLADCAVRYEPVSAPKFPANRELNREFCRTPGLSTTSLMPSPGEQIQRLAGEFPTQRNREFQTRVTGEFSRNREFSTLAGIVGIQPPCFTPKDGVIGRQLG